jgi:putative tricarboxylic transport membrane protein
VRAMVRSATWRESLDRYRWLDRHLDGDAFARFVEAEEARVRVILKKLGTGETTSSSMLPSGTYPRIVLGGLLLFGLAALVTRRGTPTHIPSHATPIVLVAIGAVLHLLLAERAGFVIAATVLFWCTARAFDHRHPLRDGLAAFAISLASYVLFARVLQLSLPAGLIERWL